jgi:hypothetical protein
VIEENSWNRERGTWRIDLQKKEEYANLLYIFGKSIEKPEDRKIFLG